MITLGPSGAILRGELARRRPRRAAPTSLSTVGAGDALTGTLLAAAARSAASIPPAVAAALPEAVAAGRPRACERWGSLELGARRARAAGGAPIARRVRAIRDRLRLVYGIPRAEPHGHPIAELILTVLSQSTNDRNRDVAYLALRERFPDWEAVRDAPVDEIEAAIRPGGISKVKSARIKSILRGDHRQLRRSATPPAIRDLSLDWLAVSRCRRHRST